MKPPETPQNGPETQQEALRLVESTARAEELAPLIEAILFAAEKPVSRALLKEMFAGNFTPTELEAALEVLQKRYAAPWGVRLQEVASGFQLRTSAEARSYVVAAMKIKPQRLSRAALETLAIVAYRQPLTRAEIDEIRGVDSGGALKSLLDRGFLRILGRKEEPGRPVLYGTSREFLEFFGLRDLQSLPSLSEIKALHEEERSLELGRPEEEEIPADSFESRKPGEVPSEIVDSLAKAMADIDRMSQDLPLEAPKPADPNEPTPKEK